MDNDIPEKSRKCLLDNKSENNTEIDGCPWYINSPKHSNCLWTYIYDKSQPDGSMPEHVQSEIANLLGWSNTKTHFMLKQAMVELVDALHKYNANQLLSSDSGINVDSSFQLNPVNNYTLDDIED